VQAQLVVFEDAVSSKLLDFHVSMLLLFIMVVWIGISRSAQGAHVAPFPSYGLSLARGWISFGNRTLSEHNCTNGKRTFASFAFA
jgi:hypothetical protein